MGRVPVRGLHYFLLAKTNWKLFNGYITDFQFLKNPLSKKWMVSAPRRAQRPNAGRETVPICPFCIGNEAMEQEVYRAPEIKDCSTLGSKVQSHQEYPQVNDKFIPAHKTGEWKLNGDDSAGESAWHIRVLRNRFPFAPIHEIIVHSPDHHKNFDELPFSHVELILQTYRQRFNNHKSQGQVYIFHNHGIAGGESLPHPHTQLVVVADSVNLDIPGLDKEIYRKAARDKKQQEARGMAYNRSFMAKSVWQTETKLFVMQDRNDRRLLRRQLPLAGRQSAFGSIARRDVLCTESFSIFCPQTSEWPDEVWIAPQKNGQGFGAITDGQITDLAFCLSRLIQIYDIRHGHEFPFNFYISPSRLWYLRLIPRSKILGGFEVGTNIMVNTQDPKETFRFIQEHFWQPDLERIKNEQRAEYWRSV